MAAAAAIIKRKEREIVNTFRGAGAMAPERARDPEELGIDQRLAFDRLVERAVLRDAGDGKFYVDEPSWNAMRRLQRRMAFVMLAVVISLFVVLAATGVFTSRS